MDKNSRVVFYSKTKPHFSKRVWLLDDYADDSMVYVGNKMKECLGGDIELQECEMAEVDIAVRIRIYDAEGNLKKV